MLALRGFKLSKKTQELELQFSRVTEEKILEVQCNVVNNDKKTEESCDFTWMACTA